VPIHESADRPGGEKHDEHRNGHRSDHHRKFFRHGHGCDDGIRRKNDVEKRDLNHCPQKTAASLCNRPVARSLEFDVDFMGAFGDEKQPPAKRIKSLPLKVCAKKPFAGSYV
jgi:hypothetical protein